MSREDVYCCDQHVDCVNKLAPHDNQRRVEPASAEAPQRQPSTFAEVMAALRNPAVSLGDLDLCQRCLYVESPYLHSLRSPCPTSTTTSAEAPQGECPCKHCDLVREEQRRLWPAAQPETGDGAKVRDAPVKQADNEAFDALASAGRRGRTP